MLGFLLLFLIGTSGAFACPAANPNATNSFPATSPLDDARRQFDSCQFPQALNTLRPAAAAEPRNAEIFYWLMRTTFEMRNYDAAIDNGQRAIALSPKNSEYLFWLGRSYGARADAKSSFGDARNTKKYFQAAVEADNDNIAARRAFMLYLVGAPWIVGGSSSKARDEIAAIRRLDPVDGHLAQAEYWLDEKEPEKAGQSIAQAFQAKPKKADQDFEIAEFYLDRGQAARAREALEAAALLEPSSPLLPFYRAAVLILEGKDFAQAEKLLETYLETVCSRSGRPSHATTHVWLGRLYEKQNKSAEAVAQYRKALELKPKGKAATEALKRLEKR